MTSEGILRFLLATGPDSVLHRLRTDAVILARAILQRVRFGPVRLEPLAGQVTSEKIGL